MNSTNPFLNTFSAEATLKPTPLFSDCTHAPVDMCKRMAFDYNSKSLRPNMYLFDRITECLKYVWDFLSMTIQDFYQVCFFHRLDNSDSKNATQALTTTRKIKDLLSLIIPQSKMIHLTYDHKTNQLHLLLQGSRFSKTDQAIIEEWFPYGESSLFITEFLQYRLELFGSCSIDELLKLQKSLQWELL